MQIRPIITGILSYGMSGRVFHAPFIAQSPLFYFKGVVERTTKAAQQDYPSIISYDTIDALIDDNEIELVIVNTPNDTHVEFAKKALLAGKHVLIEKPFAPTLEEAKELFALSESVGKLVLPFHNRRFDSDFLSLKHILEKGFVGNPIELHLRFDRFKAELSNKDFKETSNRAGNGIMYDLGSHLLDQAISLFGKPRTVTKILSKHRKGSKVDDYASLILNYKEGLNVYLTASLLVANPQKSFVLHGTLGSYVKDRCDVQENQLLTGIMPHDEVYGVEALNEEGVLSIVTTKGREDMTVPSIKGNYMLVFDSVFNAIRGIEPYYVSKDQILWQLEILSKIKKG